MLNVSVKMSGAVERCERAAAPNHSPEIGGLAAMADAHFTRAEEFWRSIPNFDTYEVSNLGRVRRRIGKQNAPVGRLLCPMLTKYGYYVVDLSHNMKVTRVSVHRLVMAAFVGPIQPDQQTNHLNGIKTDNALVNLEYTTALENTRHAIRTGLRDFRGSKHWSAQITEQDVVVIRELRANGVSRSEIADKFGISVASVKSIVARRCWTHV